MNPLRFPIRLLAGRERAGDRALAQAGEAETSAAARGFLLMCAEMNYSAEVRQAIEAVGVHVRDLGVLSGPLIVAALAAAVAWVPLEKKKKVTKQTVVAADGTIFTTEETDEEVRRVGSAALQAIIGWWRAVAPAGSA